MKMIHNIYLSFRERTIFSKKFIHYLTAGFAGFGIAKFVITLTFPYTSINANIPDLNKHPKDSTAIQKPLPEKELTNTMEGLFEKPTAFQDLSQTTILEEDKPFLLIGTLEGTASFARALVEYNNSGEPIREYAVGDMIGSAKIIYIGREFIIVLKNDEKIKIEAGSRYNPEHGVPARSGASLSSHGDKIISTDELRSFINSKTIGHDISVGPYLKNNKIEGYKINKIQNNHPLKKLGFQKGDIIYSIENYSVTDHEAMFQIYSMLKNSPPHELTIIFERKNKKQSFKFHVRN